MKYALTGKEMKLLDQNTIEQVQIPAMVLMERAALEIRNQIMERNICCDRVLIVCGANNNGGDGLALGRLLLEKNKKVHMVFSGDRNHCSPETKQQLDILSNLGVEIENEIPEEHYTLIVDAILGTGLNRDIEGRLKSLIEKMNQLEGYKLAIDVPTGIDSDSGRVRGVAFESMLTISVGYEKLGNLLYPGAKYAGECIQVPIGVVFNPETLGREPVRVLEPADMRTYPERQKDGNKGTFGKVIVIAGSEKVYGAAYFAAKSALMSGCGMVKVCSTWENRLLLGMGLPEALFTPCSNSDELNHILNNELEWGNVVIAGPGIGKSEFAKSVVFSMVTSYSGTLVLDADALNCLASEPAILKQRKGITIITPHVMEMSRLTNTGIDYVKNDIVKLAEDFSREYNVICVLKDARTVIGFPDGERVLSCAGVNGMATAGSGDVLAGLIGGLCARGIPSKEAVKLAVLCHGMAGEAASRIKGNNGMLASDLMDCIPDLIKGSCEKHLL